MLTVGAPGRGMWHTGRSWRGVRTEHTKATVHVCSRVSGHWSVMICTPLTTSHVPLFRAATEHLLPRCLDGSYRDA